MITQGSILAREVAAEVLVDPNFTEPGLLLRGTEGMRNIFGEWVEGFAIENATQLVQAPLTGQERLTVEEGLRDEDLRKFWMLGDIVALRYGLTDGDRIVLGALGPTQNRFSGATRREAEAVRDSYGVANSSWLTGYQASVGALIQLRGFGEHPIYEQYDAVDGHWAMASIYRTIRGQRWGPFTEVIGLRLDPGNE